ncbi:927_t:CDS:2 [Funneliformis mosseae]|uniref:927_t:CDS:1 n=1 Tax=Funneliformis mosseae TaxID=27381 RepID=A0A9N9CCS2_FUNMO|nr:927_t:CDS:2 [Funneliformis mosseae]
MFESIANEFLQRTPVKDWSIISLLKYIESKSELSADMIEILREEIYSVLRGFNDDININVHRNAKKRAKKLLSNFDKLFSSGNVNNFIEELKLKEERREYYMAIRRKIISANSLQTLEKHHMTRRLIDDLRDADVTASSGNTIKFILHYRYVAKKVTVVDNPFLLSNENKSNKFEIVTESRNLDKEHNKKKYNKCTTSPATNYLNAMEQSLEYNRIHVQVPPMWTKVESYLEDALKASSHGC